MKKYFSRLLVLLISCTSISTASYSMATTPGAGDDVMRLYQLKLYKHMLEQLPKKEEKKSESLIEKLLTQTSSVAKQVAPIVLPYYIPWKIGSLIANNIAYSMFGWLITVRPYSLTDMISLPDLMFMYLLAQK